jgi:adenine-specific DNA-methyltransferase
LPGTSKRCSKVDSIPRPTRREGEFEYLYYKPYPDIRTVRVAGPFTEESLSPHRVLGVDENDELIDPFAEASADYAARQTFPQMILENLRSAGVQQAHKDARIAFTALTRLARGGA